jgi:hypothetical protein
MERIDLNTAPATLLTQLPGVSKDIARKIVNYRERHGWFTAWEELKAVPHFPADRLDEIQEHALLSCPEDRPGQTQTECLPPRHLSEEKLERKSSHSGGYTNDLRARRRGSK